jgi:D-cysteine desulfhydrase
MVPLERLERLGHHLGIDLRVLRDDLFPITGGNKARKGVGIIANIARNGHNAIVTTGGLQSNHARVMALMAAARGWPCKLVLHGDYSRCACPNGNLLLMGLVGADIEVVRPEQISEKIEESVRYLERRGYSPAVIPGGGHTLQGALAYVDAAAELMRLCEPVGWIPDVVIVPSGAGYDAGRFDFRTEARGLSCQGHRHIRR